MEVGHGFKMNLILTLFSIGIVCSTTIDRRLTAEENSGGDLGIVDGKAVSIKKYPFMVSYVDDRELQGTGVIINKHWILTTAFNGKKIGPNEGQLRVGSTHWNTGGDLLNITKVVVHPLYTDDQYIYDFALCKTDKPIKFNKKTEAIQIGSGKLEMDTQGEVLGWGGSSGKYNNSLLVATNTVSSFGECKFTYYSNIDQTNICTAPEEAGPCDGDYGDAFVVNGTLQGLYAGGYDCTNKPRVYAYVPYVANWIRRTIQKNK